MNAKAIVYGVHGKTKSMRAREKMRCVFDIEWRKCDRGIETGRMKGKKQP